MMKIKLLFLLLLCLGCASAQAVTDQTIYLNHEGLTRKYILHLPAKFNRLLTYPVFLVLHGGRGSAQSIIGYSNFSTYADAAGVIAVYPEGTTRPGENADWHYWNDGRVPSDTTANDVGFIQAVIRDVKMKARVGKVIACGISNGSFMSIRLGKQLTDIAGVMAVCGHRGPDELIPAPGRALPILFVVGKVDPYVKYDGGVGTSGVQVRPFPTVLGQWQVYNGCAVTAASHYKTGQAEFWRYPGTAPVGLWVCYDNGHQWPGAAFNMAMYLAGCGPINHDIQASQEAIRFFK